MFLCLNAENSEMSDAKPSAPSASLCPKVQDILMHAQWSQAFRQGDLTRSVERSALPRIQGQGNLSLCVVVVVVS